MEAGLKDIRTLTIRTADNKTEYAVNLGEAIKDRVGREIGFKSVISSPNLSTMSEVNAWIKKHINN